MNEFSCPRCGLTYRGFSTSQWPIILADHDEKCTYPDDEEAIR